jgi:hypothetical protein
MPKRKSKPENEFYNQDFQCIPNVWNLNILKLEFICFLGFDFWNFSTLVIRTKIL